MNQPPSKEDLDLYVAHTMTTLPDSIRQRKAMLHVLLQLLPRTSEHRVTIRTMLETLNAHEATQLTFRAFLH